MNHLAVDVTARDAAVVAAHFGRIVELDHDAGSALLLRKIGELVDKTFGPRL